MLRQLMEDLGFTWPDDESAAADDEDDESSDDGSSSATTTDAEDDCNEMDDEHGDHDDPRGQEILNFCHCNIQSAKL